LKWVDRRITLGNSSSVFIFLKVRYLVGIGMKTKLILIFMHHLFNDNNQKKDKRKKENQIRKT
jgi:hypothetical protein